MGCLGAFDSCHCRWRGRHIVERDIQISFARNQKVPGVVGGGLEGCLRDIQISFRKEIRKSQDLTLLV